MKRSTIGIIAGLVILALWAISSYNGMVNEEENVNQAWGNVETTYQRRMDLIPNLVNIVKGQANYEAETLQKVIEARSKATAINLNVEDLTEENMKKFQAAQGELSSALNKLMAVTEAYPELKANEGFMNLQSQLEGTENRINEARKKFNEVVTVYNKKVRQFPGSIFAGIFGFQTKSQFAAEAGAEKAPEVKF